jgi:hypothetical protein
VDLVGPTLQSLLAKADEELRKCHRPTGLVALAPGNTVAWDNCCGTGDDGSPAGQLWVRLISQVPQPQPDQPGGIDGVQVRAAVGVVRCMHCLKDDGSFPTAEEMNGDTLRTTRDADTLLSAIRDWKSEEWDQKRFLNWKSLKVESGLTLGPQGCCGGFEWTLTFNMQVCVGCG